MANRYKQTCHKKLDHRATFLKGKPRTLFILGVQNKQVSDFDIYLISHATRRLIYMSSVD
jgi:hypothetical protein